MNLKSIFTLAVVCVSLAHAGPGTSGGILLDACPGARPAARGGAFVAASDVYAVNYNPGALADITNMQVATAYIKGALDTGYEYGACALPVKGLGVLGFSIFAFQGGTMDVFDTLGDFTVRSAQNDYLFSGALGMQNLLIKNLNLGVTVKYLISSLAETYNASTLTFDAGGTYKIENIVIGFAACNLLGGLKYLDFADRLPITARAGAEYLFTLDSENDLLAAVDLSFNVERVFKVFIGAEYAYNKTVFGRLGYRINDGDGGLCIGIGCKVVILENSVQTIDYAFIPSLSGIMDSHRISVGISFGEELKKDEGRKRKFFIPNRILR